MGRREPQPSHTPVSSLLQAPSLGFSLRLLPALLPFLTPLPLLPSPPPTPHPPSPLLLLPHPMAQAQGHAHPEASQQSSGLSPPPRVYPRIAQQSPRLSGLGLGARAALEPTVQESLRGAPGLGRGAEGFGVGAGEDVPPALFSRVQGLRGQGSETVWPSPRGTSWDHLYCRLPAPHLLGPRLGKGGPGPGRGRLASPVCVWPSEEARSPALGLQAMSPAAGCQA